MPLPKGMDKVEVSVLSETAPVPVQEYMLCEGSITVQALSRTPYHITQLLDHGPRLV